jgi:N-acetylneuraminic acid mutarotase
VVVGGVPTTALNTGARYNPATDTWTPMSTTGAPSARTAHRAIWTGTRMIVWGGDGLGFSYTNTGGIYDPATDTWVGPTSTVNAPSARGSAAVVWTGSRMIVWGGENPGKLNTGSFYDPATDSWSGSTSAVGCPTARSHMPGVWTGQEMILWGGVSAAPANLDTGARYNPTTDTWTDLSVIGVPEARSSHVLVWTGREMIAWGGVNATTNLNTGGIYRPPGLVPGTYTAEILIQAATLGQLSSARVQVTLTVTP